MAISRCLGKNLDRYEELYKRINQCPGERRQRLAPVGRSIGSALPPCWASMLWSSARLKAWRADYIAEFAFDNAVFFLSGVGRFASEMQLWSTDEYHMAELDPSFAGTSSIMPRKNPDALERARLAAAGAMGPWWRS